MLSENLAMLRSLKGLSQEQAAEIAGVARQSYAKWEQGDTLPDVEKCARLAAFYGVTLDALVNQENRVGAARMAPAPLGKHLWGTVVLGSRGQIVIPKGHGKPLLCGKVTVWWCWGTKARALPW